MSQTVAKILLSLTMSFPLLLNGQSEVDHYLSVEYSYGKSQHLPSLVTNNFNDFELNKNYSDLWIQGGFQISEKLSYRGSLQLTDKPHALIATKFSRPDFLLSTGRFQQSVVNFSSGNFKTSIGRDNMLSEEGITLSMFDYPRSGDGFSWSYAWNAWTFKHVFQVLPAEEANGVVFRRSVSYHHLARNVGNFSFGVGEYFILTGEDIGFDLKRLNPFLPYSLNSHDSEGNYYSGFSGDADNAVIKAFLNWKHKNSTATVSVYIDEFHIDGYDREVYNDAILLSLSGATQQKIYGVENNLKIGFSISNPNFGQHPGPFTSLTFARYPLLGYLPGMKQLLYVEDTALFTKSLTASLGGIAERWVPISMIAPPKMNDRTQLDSLVEYSDYRITLGINYAVNQTPFRMEVCGWLGSDERSSSGSLISLYYLLGN